MARYLGMVRRRIVVLYEHDYSTSNIAEIFGICGSGVRRVSQRGPARTRRGRAAAGR